MNLRERENGSKPQRIVHFIVNPEAQNGGSMKCWKRLEKKLISQNLSYRSYFTAYPGHAVNLTKEILSSSEEQTLIVSIGGDGTLHEIINGAASYKHAMITSISAGSANDFSRGFNVPANPEELLKDIFRQFPSGRLVDIGESTIGSKTVYFINSLGIGLDAEVSYLVNNSIWKKRFNRLKLGKLIYILFFLKNLFTYQRPDMRVEIDGVWRKYSKVWFIVAANQPFFGGGIKIAPAAVPDDGKLNMIIVHDISRLKLLFVFITVYWGGHLKIKNVDSISCREAAIESVEAAAIQTDGEIAGNSKARIKVLEKKLRIVTR